MTRRRVLSLLLMLVAVAAVVALASGRNNTADGPGYTLELDNAFGLVPGSEVRIAGVKGGRVDSMDVDPVSHHALLKIVVTTGDVGRLHSDVFCEARPQSLIGEYFVDCQPGHSRTLLKPAAGSEWRTPPRRSRSTWCRTCSGCPTASGSRCSCTSWAPAWRAAAATSTRRSGAPCRRCASSTRCWPCSASRTGRSRA